MHTRSQQHQMNNDKIDDPDSIMSGKTKEDQLDNASFTLSLIDLLANYDEKLDPRSYQTKTDEFIDEWLLQKKEKSGIKPYVSVVDLNNSADSLYENKPKTAIEVGVEMEF